MEPIGPLMWEHRTIERAVGLVEKGLDRIHSTGQLDARLLVLITDFFRMYADRTHHGKEEDILFQKLGQKPLSDEHQKTMDELLSEHVRGRRLVKQINQGLDRDIEEAGRGLETVAGAMGGGCCNCILSILKKKTSTFSIR